MVAKVRNGFAEIGGQPVASDRPEPDFWLSRTIGTGLILLGIMVLCGWMLQSQVLVQLVPGFAAMVIDSAIGFCLAGSAILARLSSRPKARRWSSVASLALLGLAVLNAIQLATGLDLGISLPRLHAWIQDNNPHPGQMSEPTTVGFTLASLSLLMLMHRSRAYVTELGQTLALLVLVIGASALLGYLLKLEVLYSWYLFSRMAAHTAVGMLLLGFALRQLWRENHQLSSEARPIVMIGLVSTVLATVTVGITSASWFRAQSERDMLNTLAMARDARAEIMTTTIKLRSQRAVMVTTRQHLLAQLALLAHDPHNPSALEQARHDIASLMPYGFNSIKLLDRAGHLLIQLGSALDADIPKIPLQFDVPGSSSLAWHGEFVLTSRNDAVIDGETMGAIEVEQPLPDLNAQLAPVGLTSARDRLLVCSPAAATSGMDCFEFARSGARKIDPAPELVTILNAIPADGAGAETIRDAAGPLALSYGNIGNTGLIIAALVDPAAFYTPARSALSYGLLLVLLIAIFAALATKSKVRPVVERLARSEGRYQRVVAGLGEGLFLQDEHYQIVAANPAMERIVGIESSALIGRSTLDPAWNLTDENGHQLTPDEHPSVLASRDGVGRVSQRIQFRRPDGALRWLDVSTTVGDDLIDGVGRGVITTIEDVTDQHLTNQRLLEAERRFRLLVDSVDDYAIYLVDTTGKVASWNPGAEKIKGYRAEDIIGQHFSVFFTDEDRAAGKPDKAMAKARDDGSYSEEGWRVRQDGRRFWASVVMAAVHDEHGQLAGYAKIARDLSERKHAEAVIAEAHRRVRSMIDSAPFSIITSDNRGIIDCFNPAAERLTFYSRDEMIGHVVQPIHDRDEVVARAEELSKEFGEPVEPGLDVFTMLPRRGITDQREWTYIRKDGTRVPVDLAVSAMRDPVDGTISGYLGIAHDISERKRREAYTHHVAHHDHLTRLPTRALLNDRIDMALARARRSKGKVAVMLLDLDHFKRINDSLGHHVGDELLCGIAARLMESVRESDTVARLGGDEFVIVLPELTSSSEAQRVAEKVVARVSKPMMLGEHEVQVTPSIGLAMFPDDGDTVHTLMKNADLAMYHAKAEGRNSYRVYQSGMQKAGLERLEIENAMRRALDRNEFRLHYQPQVCLDSGRVIGMEALLRWTDPVLGVMPPDKFIPIAEETGLILPLGHWVLETACREGRKLQVQTGVPLRLAVNLSAQQFRQGNLLEQLDAVLESSGLAPDHLELEITEGTLMEKTDQAIERMRQIRSRRIGIAIDDFGIGFSSLSYVARFPITTLKIDRTFVAKVTESATDAAVAKSIVALAQTLQVMVVAEGVETMEQLQFLRDHCCDAGQGHLLGRPVPTESFSVQGFHFGKARDADEFASSFPELVDQCAQKSIATLSRS